jgi:hypothetical protein
LVGTTGVCPRVLCPPAALASPSARASRRPSVATRAARSPSISHKTPVIVGRLPIASAVANTVRRIISRSAPAEISW